MPVKEVIEDSEVDKHLTALISNAGAVRAVTEAIQGTLGPKGLDCMLVDEYGTMMVTNDGVSILKMMDVNHPAARMLINAAQFQEEAVGDGTTTTTILAGALIAEGVDQIIKGVPVTKVVEGISMGIADALSDIGKHVTHLDNLESPILEKIALVSGRNHRDIAELIIKATRIIGEEGLREEGFKLADQVVSLEGADSFLIQGTIIDRMPLNPEMPQHLQDVKFVILDDALEPVKVDNAALNTEAGFKYYLQNQAELKENITKLAELGIKAVFTDRIISESLEDVLTELGILAVQKVATKEWRRLAKLTGARPLKKGSLERSGSDLEKYIGTAAKIDVDQKYQQIRVSGYPHQKFVTIVIGAATNEVMAEKTRIATDTAAAVQAAWCDGVVPGGGSVELGIAVKLSRLQQQGILNYGYRCVIEALKRPMSQICINAGFNPLERIEAILTRAENEDSYVYGIDCENGMIADMTNLGIWDPYTVKYHAIKTAGEVGTAILRIDTMIRMKKQNSLH